VAVIAGFGAVQVIRLDRAWLDVRPSVAFLKSRVAPGERLLIDNSWPYVHELYRSGHIRSPFDVYDVYRVQHLQARGGLCDFDWYVESPGGASWPQDIRRRVHACGTYRPAFRQTGFRREALGRDLRYFSFDANVVVYRNVGRRP
jgi:hypothetical protein